MATVILQSAKSYNSKRNTLPIRGMLEHNSLLGTYLLPWCIRLVTRNYGMYTWPDATEPQSIGVISFCPGLSTVP